MDNKQNNKSNIQYYIFIALIFVLGMLFAENKSIQQVVISISIPKSTIELILKIIILILMIIAFIVVLFEVSAAHQMYEIYKFKSYMALCIILMFVCGLALLLVHLFY